MKKFTLWILLLFLGFGAFLSPLTVFASPVSNYTSGAFMFTYGNEIDVLSKHFYVADYQRYIHNTGYMRIKGKYYFGVPITTEYNFDITLDFTNNGDIDLLAYLNNFYQYTYTELQISSDYQPPLEDFIVNALAVSFLVSSKVDNTIMGISDFSYFELSVPKYFEPIVYDFNFHGPSPGKKVDSVESFRQYCSINSALYERIYNDGYSQGYSNGLGAVPTPENAKALVNFVPTMLSSVATFMFTIFNFSIFGIPVGTVFFLSLALYAIMVIVKIAKGS